MPYKTNEPQASMAAMALTVKLMYRFDEIERQEQGEAAEQPVVRGTVLIFLPGTMPPLGSYLPTSL